MEFTRPSCGYYHCEDNKYPVVCVGGFFCTLTKVLTKLGKGVPKTIKARTDTGFEIELPYQYNDAHEKHWIQAVFTKEEKDGMITESLKWIKALVRGSTGYVHGIPNVNNRIKYDWKEWPTGEQILGFYLLGYRDVLIGHYHPHPHGN